MRTTGPVAALIGQELEHVRRHHLDRVLGDDREEHLQVERAPPAPCSVGTGPRRTPDSESTNGSPNAKRASPAGDDERIRHGTKVIPASSPPPVKCTGMPDGSPVY